MPVIQQSLNFASLELSSAIWQSECCCCHFQIDVEMIFPQKWIFFDPAPSKLQASGTSKPNTLVVFLRCIGVGTEKPPSGRWQLWFDGYPHDTFPNWLPHQKVYRFDSSSEDSKVLFSPLPKPASPLPRRCGATPSPRIWSSTSV